MPFDPKIYVEEILKKYPVRGYDISAWQNKRETPRTVDFKKMKSTGAQFCFMRVTFGLTPDIDFVSYWSLAKAEGLKRGGYMFLLPNLSIETQTNLFCDILLANGIGELEPVIDVEKWNFGTPNGNMVALASNIIFRRLGKIPIIYTGYYVWKDDVVKSNMSSFSINPLWLGAYDVKTPLIPAPWNCWRFWQFHIKGYGVEAGVESLDIDQDVFIGSQDDFNSLYGKSSDTSNDGGNDMLYDTNANLVMLWEVHKDVTKEMLSKFDGVVSVAWDGHTRNPEFTNHCQAAYDANKPFIALIKPWLFDYPGMGSGGVSSQNWQNEWPPFAKDYNCQNIDKVIFSGDPANENKRVIQAVVIDLTDSTSPEGKTLTSSWLVYAAKYFIWAFSERYKLPWYTLWANDLIATFPDDQTIAAFLTGDRQGTSIKALVPTVKNSRNFPVPVTPPVSPKMPGAHVPYSDKWYMWWTGSYLDSVFTSKVVSWIYNGTPSKFLLDLNFGKTPEPPPVVPPIPTTGLRAEILALLDKYKIV